jgi:hypothetical protein
MISLTDQQLKTVMDAAAEIDPGRRDMYLQRVSAMLTLRGRFSDADVVDVVMLASCGLVHQRTDAA